MNALKELQHYGQSVWLDYIRRSLIESGELKRLIADDGLRGVTSNPAIFEKAIAGSTDYASALDALGSRRDLDAKALYETLAIRDVQDGADVLKPVYQATERRDGYVSLEVSPNLAHDTSATLEEARRLWKSVDRDNLMIKVPATDAGIAAIRQLIAEGINLNVTLLFAQEMYERVAEAYFAGLDDRAAAGGDVARVASVASFFISRIDSLVDTLLEARLQASSAPMERALLKALRGRVAIANAKCTYQRFKELSGTPRWARLAGYGAMPQRLLWASTSTKNPNYRDVIYIEELVGRDTVNTIPPATFDAFRDHGRPRASLEEQLDEAHDTMRTLERVGISMKEITDQLLKEGVALFAEAFGKLLAATQKRCRAPRQAINRQTWTLPDDLATAVSASLRDWAAGGKARRLWARDAALWTGRDEASWLGWLGITDDQLANGEHLRRVAEEARTGDFSHVLLLGMGGSSLGPEVLKMTFGRIPGYPELHVLDSTDPAQVRTFEQKVDLAKTLFIVSSKSGSTLEPNIFRQYFFERVKSVVGAERAGDRFIAITDPGSKMQQVAKAERFRRIFFGLPSIGGRYSVLSDFGMVPAAAMGADVGRILEQADEMAKACASCVPVEDNPGVVLGTIMGVLATRGRDKVTLIASPGIQDLGAWLEQLLAESTGKQGKGLIPVDREPLGAPRVYGGDRLFVYLRLSAAPDPHQDAAVAELERAGHPVVRIAIDDRHALGAEFFRWEMATAVAGAILGINPFDQPDVEASKIATRKLTDEYERTGSLPPETPLRVGDSGFAGALRAHLETIRPGDYVALLAYLEMNDEHQAKLQAIRRTIRDRYTVATCLGFGPRFLHSTGQAYKGGPNSGVVIQLTCDDAVDLPVPGQKYTFGVVKAAQARGDLQVLQERGRRALRVHLGTDVRSGLQVLAEAIGT